MVLFFLLCPTNMTQYKSKICLKTKLIIQVHNLLSEILKTEKLKFFHGGRLQPKYDGHHDNDDDIDVPSSPGSSSKV
jgi:hypothetical protein